LLQVPAARCACLLALVGRLGAFFNPKRLDQGRVAEVPPKFARVGGSRPDFGPEKAKKHKKTLIKSKLNQN
jgi:hypothetical protein